MPGSSGRDEAGLPSVEAGDTLRLQVWSSVACTFRAVIRIRPTHGGKTSAYPFEVTAASTRAQASQIYKIERAGIIDSVMVEATPKGTESAPTQRGQSYAKLDLSNGGCLACGYVYPGHQPALNEFVEPGPAGGHGAITRVNTAATVTTGRVLGVVPTGAIWRWIRGDSRYTASATVGTRANVLRWRDPSGNVYGRTPANANTANQIRSFEIATNYTTDGVTVHDGISGTTTVPCPQEHLVAGHDVQSVDTAAIDGLDVTSIEGSVEEWTVPN